MSYFRLLPQVSDPTTGLLIKTYYLKFYLNNEVFLKNFFNSCVFFIHNFFNLFIITFFRLLHAQAAYCAFEGAAKTYELALETVDKLNDAGYKDTNHAALYAEFSVLFFIRSEYDQAYK